MATETPSTRGFETAHNWSYSTRVKTLFAVFTGVAVFGWLVSAFLSGIHFFAIPTIPDGQTLSGSLEVVTSSYAYVGPVPLATLGAGYYLATIALALWWFNTRHPLVVKILTPITATGVVASSYFVWLQLVPIGEICPFCMMSAAATVVLFGLELVILKESDTPGVRTLVGDFQALLAETDFIRVLLPSLIGAFTLAVLFGVTLAPIPGDPFASVVAPLVG